MQKSLSYSKGITTVPSDMLSEDTELSESVGMVFRDGEMHPIQKGVAVGTLTGKIMYVHRGSGYTNIITRGTGNALTAYRYADGGLEKIGDYGYEGTLKTIGAVGNTLVIASTSGMSYMRFVAGEYNVLGDIPEPQYHAGLSLQEMTRRPNGVVIDFSDYLIHNECKAYYDKDDKLCKIEDLRATQTGGSSITSTTITENEAVDEKTVTWLAYASKYGKEDELKSAAQAVVADAYAKVKKKKCFAFPFFVRFALRMYDGTYTRISAPILCLPSIRNNGTLYPYGRSSTSNSLVDTSVVKPFYSDMDMCELTCHFYIDNMKAWSDIIKDVVVFATPEVLPYGLDGDWEVKQPSEIMKQPTWEGCIGAMYRKKQWTYARVKESSMGVQTDGPLSSAIMPANMKSDEEIMSQLNNGMTFYKLFEVELSESTRGVTLHSMECVSDGVVENLTSQEQLQVDDYYGWTRKTAEGMLEYNSRIQMYGVKRWPFKGFGSVQAAAQGLPYETYVHIMAPTMDAWVKSECDSIEEALFTWYYYPDPNATEVMFFGKYGEKYRLKLRQHPRLNGAYAMEGLPNGNLPGQTAGLEKPTVDANASEDLSSQIFTSVVNNPYVYEASGDNTVGTGSIVGIAANTEPVSQGQFGQYPLIVFTTEGTYGMSVNEEGLYSASYPMSREVCNNAGSITPTGKMVFFTSERGLMAVSGGTVTLVSGQLQGRNPSRFVSVGDGNFLKFLGNALLAYDYRDSLLHILSTEEEYEYVYSIKDGTFGKATVGDKAMAVGNAYPDSLIQWKSGEVESLMGKPDANDDTESYDGELVTRPLKLGGSVQLKTIHRMVHLLDSAKGTVRLRLYGSNDCRNWCELRSLHGKPWKYYTLSYSLRGMAAADTFAGTVVDYQVVLPDKIR